MNQRGWGGFLPPICFLSEAFFFCTRFIYCLLGSGLLPLGVNADYAADGSSQADEAIVEADPVEGGKGDGQVADVGDELEAAGESFPGKFSHVSYRCFFFLLAKGNVEVYMRKGGRIKTHFRMRLLSTTPSPSFRSILASRSFSLYSVYSCAATLKTSPMAQKR